LERAIDAVALLAADGRDVLLEVIGRIHDPGYAQELVQRAQARGIADRFVLRGALSRSAISTAFGKATVALYVTRHGAIPSSGSLLAMLAHGVPVVAVRTPHDDDVFAGALHYADDNDRAVAAALRALVDEPAAAASLVSAGLSRWRSEFGWDRVADGLLSALEPEMEGSRVSVIAT
jgi:glycosyltransferase involved in cell wall biosynthesis